MKRSLALIIMAAGLTLLACQPPSSISTNTNEASSDSAASAADWESFAEQVVTQNAGVKENDIVLIFGGAQDSELLESLAVHVRKVGAFPLVKLNSDRMTRRMVTDVPEKYDSQVSQMDMKLASIVNVRIGVDSALTEDLMAGVDPKRREASDKASQIAENEFFRRGVRQVFIGNGFYPAEWRAQRFGISQPEMAKLFRDGIHMDYSELPAKAEEVRKFLAGGKELHITNPNGTDLKVNIQGRPAGVSDGIISAEDVRKGGSNATAWLPAGEVYLVPVAGTAEGKVVQTRGFFGDNGKELTDLTVTFEKGKLVSLTGSGPGFPDLKARYDAAGPGKEGFAYVDFGINPSVKIPESSKLGNWVPAGTITVGFGENVWAGGNVQGFGHALFLPGSTVTLDGKPIIENGQLKL